MIFFGFVCLFLLGVWVGAVLSRLVAERSERSVRRWLDRYPLLPPPMPVISLQPDIDEGESNEIRTLH